MAANIVNACCVLHNMANLAQVRPLTLPEQDRGDEHRLQETPLRPGLADARASTADLERRHPLA